MTPWVEAGSRETQLREPVRGQEVWSPWDLCRRRDHLARPGRKVAAGPRVLCVVSRGTATRGVLARAPQPWNIRRGPRLLQCLSSALY